MSDTPNNAGVGLLVGVADLCSFLRLSNSCTRRVREDQLIGADWAEDNPEEPRVGACLKILNRYLTADGFALKPTRYGNVLRDRWVLTGEVLGQMGKQEVSYIRHRDMPGFSHIGCDDPGNFYWFTRSRPRLVSAFEGYLFYWLVQALRGYDSPEDFRAYLDAYEALVRYEDWGKLATITRSACQNFLIRKSSVVRGQINRTLKYGSNKVPGAERAALKKTSKKKGENS